MADNKEIQDLKHERNKCLAVGGVNAAFVGMDVLLTADCLSKKSVGLACAIIALGIAAGYLSTKYLGYANSINREIKQKQR